MESKAGIDQTAFMLTCVLALIWAVWAFDLTQAWLAPVCQSFRDLDGWCLPIGFEGPFADYWANRSLLNARAAGTIHFTIASLTLGAAIFLLTRRVPHFRRAALLLILIDVLAIAFMIFVLNDYS